MLSNVFVRSYYYCLYFKVIDKICLHSDHINAGLAPGLLSKLENLIVRFSFKLYYNII